MFSDATDHVLDQLDLGAAYRERAGGSLFTVETHTRFLKEVKLGTSLEITTRVLGADDKRLHLWHEMRSVGVEPVATQETLLVHVNLASGSVEPSEAMAAAAGIASAELPPGAGRAIGRPGR